MESKQAKRRTLQELRAFNPHPEQVQAELFKTHRFFDPEDKAQVKYEMMRRRELDKAPLIQSCREFGFTRESYRHVLERFRSEGMGGLFGRKRGRRKPLKVNEQVRHFLIEEHSREPDLSADELMQLCQQHCGVSISRRTLYRVLADAKEQKKKHVRKSETLHEGTSFLCWAGELQRSYERWRAISLSGGEVSLFMQWGMTVFAPESSEGKRRLLEVRRRRATVRAGAFPIGDLISDFGLMRSAPPLCRLAPSTRRWRFIDESSCLRAGQ